jgi:hypothetical protein
VHFENDPAEFVGWVLGTVSGALGIAVLVGIPAWFIVHTGGLNVGIPLLVLPISALCLIMSREGFAPQISVDLERSPRIAHVVRMNIVTRRRRTRTYRLPDDACIIMESSDCIYSLTIRRSPFRSIYLTQPRDGDEARAQAVEIATFLGIQIEYRV